MSIRETIQRLGEHVRNIAALPGEGIRQLRAAGTGTTPRHARAISATRTTTAWAVAVVVAMIAAVTLVFVPQPAQAGVTGTTSVDPDTTNAWQNVLQQDGQVSTQNIGRIWTDKSVFDNTYTFEGQLNGSVQKGNSDFVVGLSALSSTSNLTETTTSSQPLDIVLVLDDSGSMDYSMNGGYAPTFDVSENLFHPTYYALVGDRYVEIEEERGGLFEGFSHERWLLNGVEVFPMTSESDTESGHIQFYEQRTISRHEALTTAANDFIDQTEELNARISSEDDKIRLAMVEFSSNASIRNYLTVCEGEKADDLRQTIDGLNTDGGTNPGAAMQSASMVLNGARQGAKKVVIFFTDGEPDPTSNGYPAVTNAYYVKNTQGATIYTIGIFDGADPSADPTDRGTSDANVLMQAMSSNYPQATQWNRNSLGNRAPDSDYYKATSDAGQLAEIFDEIFKESTENVGSGSPIQSTTQSGAQETPGNLTFTDQLGSYMEVTGTGAGTDKMQLAYADQLYTSDSRSEQSIQGGTVYTYHFSGQVAGNSVYGPADLSSITVKVIHYDDAAQGDLVEVTIPASVIPMRNYNVDADNGTMTVTDAYPIRLFYGVSLKQAAENAIEQGNGDVYDAIVQSNASTDNGTIDFYTNLYTSGNGDTTAVFTPNEANKFYYYTSDTPLYVDKACTQRATSQNIGQYDMVYYQDTYYVQTEDGGYEQRTTSVAVNLNGPELSHIAYEQGWNGNAYMPAHTQRTDRPATLNTSKSENKTGTATSALVPSWSGANEVTQALGNNGKMSYPMPGSLEIKKTVDWTNASDQTQQGKNSFTFDISLTDADNNPISGTYNYYVDNAETASGKVTFTNGQASIQVNGGTTVRIDGLASGAKFTVTEQGVGQNGFTVTSDFTSQTDVENTNTTDGIVTGTIPAGSQVSLSFDNRYHAEDVNLSTKATLQVEKNLTGRDWRDTDEFTFAIDGLANTAEGNIPTPKPAETTVTVDDQTADYTKAFGDITFTAPGEYRYSVVEDNDTNPIAGIDYSDAIYRVVVTVTDNGTGQLVVSDVKVEQTQNDEGSMGAHDDPVAVKGTTMTFTNNYNAGVGTTNINAVKSYTDTTGTNPINLNKFQFQIEALGGYETDGGSSADYTVDAADVPMPAGSDGTTKQVGNTGSQVNFGTITYDGNDTGKTFEYKVTETGHAVDGTVEQGMTYDQTEHIVQVKVEEITDDTGTHIVATVQGDYADPKNLSFTNTYDPSDATLTGNNAIHGTKTLTGREMNEGEAFHFQLTQTNGPKTLDPNDDENAYVTVLSAPEYQTVSQGDEDMAFSFDDMTFSVAGTYTFQVNEVADDQGTETTDGAGLTYDKNICTVTVEVKDNHNGTMTATPSYSNPGDSKVTDKAVFTNTYQASMNYGANGAGGINVTKQMLDRPMANGDFSFTITPEGEDTAYETFSNTAAEKDGTVTMKQLQNLTFDQDDAGKTFTYIVDESDPAEGAALPEVDYDQSQYKVEIQVIDNGDGTMHTVTTVTKIKNADGSEASEVVVNAADSSADGYTVPTFGFVNDYNPNGTTAGGENAQWPLQVTKTVEDAPSPAGVEYTFTLTPAEDYGTKVTGLTDGKLTAHTTGSIAEGESQTVDFGQLTFTEPGTYIFNVQEDQPAADDGWTFDDADGNGQTDKHQITVVVTDLNDEGAYDGNLYIQSVTGSPAQVTNSYHANEVTVGGEGAAQQISVQKTVTGADSTENFKFQLEPIVDETNTEEVWANNVEPAQGNDGTATINGGVTQAQGGTATFGGLTFKAEGTYKFNVTEVQAHDDVDDPAGWTYDTHTSVVTVTVTDEGNDGQLDAAVSYDNSAALTDADKGCTTAAAFTNSYAPGEITTTDDTSVDTNIKVTKSVTGAPATEAFTFSLKLADGQDGSNVFEGTGNDKTPFDGVEVTTSDNIAADTTETKAFAGVTFTKAGDYKFVIDETTTTDKAGWTYDDSTHEITVHVADQDAKLVITGIDNNNPTFTNAYVPNEVTTDGQHGLDNLQVTKQVTGAPALSDFEFSLKLTSNNGDNVKLGSGETATAFPADGITTGTTDLTGKEGNAAKQTVSFGDMSFTATGTYTFEVAETTTTTADGWAYDNTAKTITVEVTDDNFDGQLDAKVTGDNPTITNAYKAGSVVIGGESGNAGIQVQKTLTGADRGWQDGDSFEFTLEAVDGAPMPESDGDKVTITNESDPKTATFGQITYDKAGTYEYTVKETKGDQGGVTYDEHTAKVTVTVTDDDFDGQLDATVAYNNTSATTDEDKAVAGAAAFTNTYAAKGKLDGSANLTVTKNLTGRDWNDDDSFIFTLAAADEATKSAVDAKDVVLPDNASGLAIAKDTEDHKASFGNITFNKAGQYGFTIKESVPEDADANMTYDTAERFVSVEVTDNNDGTLTAKVVSSDDLTFTNSYAAPVAGQSDPVNLNGTKVLEGGTLNKAQFFFSVTPLDGAPMGDSFATGNANGVDGDDAGSITLLKNVVYTADDMGNETSKDFKYVVTEEIPSEGNRTQGLTYDTTAYQVTVHVQEQDGTLVASEPSIQKGTFDGAAFTAADEGADVDAIVFTNSFAEAKPVTITPLEVTKVLKGDRPTPLQDGEFTFELAIKSADPTDGITMPDETTVANDADGKVQFGDVAFTKAGTYTLQIKEQVPAEGEEGYDEHMTYSDNVLTSTFEVADTDQDGTLEVTRTDSTGDTTFTNTYNSNGENDATLKGADNLVVTKELKGRSWAKDDSFTFTLAAHGAETQAAIDDGTVVLPGNAAGLTINNDTTDHKASFGDITFKAEGTYYFDVTEQQGDVANITYDTTPRLVAVEVIRGDGGKLEAKVSGEANLTFTNVYAAEGTVGFTFNKLGLEKVLKGKIWDGDSFEFELVPVEGTTAEGFHLDAGDVPMPENAIATVTKPDKENGDSAAVRFGEVTYDTVGTYTYQIREIAGEDPNMTYDGHTFTVMVKVTDNKQGKLVAEVVEDSVSGSPIFTNVYYDKEDAKSVSSDKGDGLMAGVGDELTYTIDWASNTLDENGNPVAATVKIEDRIPAGTSFVSASEHGENNNGTVTWDLGEKAYGETGSVTVTVKVEQKAGGTELTNTADIYNNESKVTTNPVTTTVPGKSSTDETPDTGIQVGDTLDYTIEWANHEDSAQTVTVVDTLPAGLTYVGVAEGQSEPEITTDDDGLTVLTWNLGEQQPGASGTVTFKAKVNENATTVKDPVINQATVTVGDNSYQTNTTGKGDKLATGDLTISKTVKAENGADVDKDKSFAFTITLKGADGATDLTGKYAAQVYNGDKPAGPEFEVSGVDDPETAADKRVENTFTLKDGERIVITGLPEGAHYSVTEAPAGDGYAQTEPSAGKPVEGVIPEGDENASGSFTNTYIPGSVTVGDEDGKSNIKVTKQVAGQATDATFDFRLSLTDGDASGITGLGEDGAMTASTDGAIADGGTQTVNFGALTFSKVGDYTFAVEETSKAPADSGWTYDNAPKTVTVHVTDEGSDGQLDVKVDGNNPTITNSYKPGGDVTVDTSDAVGGAQLAKVLEGRDWADGDTFSFTITGDDERSQAHMPEQTTVVVGKPAEGNRNTFNFGPFTFDQAGTYKYTVKENAGEAGGMTYDQHEAKITIVVSDNLKGGYTAAVTIANGTFTNEYGSELDYDAAAQGGLNIVKTVNNHTMEAFTFDVKPADPASADKLGIALDGETRSTTATAYGNMAIVPVITSGQETKFTQADEGVTYAYTISEVNDGKPGFEYDETVYTVAITTADDGQGGIKVTTTVTNGTTGESTSYVYDNDDETVDATAVVPFTNTYDAKGTLGGDGEGAADIKATKALANRPQVAGEFTFNVTDADGTVVSTGTNDADGNITFGGINYDAAGLIADAENGVADMSIVDGKRTYTYQYKVTEDTASLDKGVTAVAGSFSITVTVTDNNDGTLSFAVAYPDGGDGLEFRNAYGTGKDGSVTLSLGGDKVLKVESGDNAPDITGKFTFTLTGSEGAPMPAKTKATNDVAGNVSFGDVTYTMANVFGDTGDAAETRSAGRSKTFTYTVAESGKVAGVTNDPESSRTFTVKVTDNGDGTVSVTDGDGNPVTGGAQFTFTNTYAVQPTGPSDPTDPNPDDPNGKPWVTIAKTLDGRDLKDGEFQFAMTGIAGSNTEGMSTTGTNDAKGNVTLGDGVTFAAPGTYLFSIAEVQGDEAGVDYDGRVYQALATVTDNGDGTLKVAWQVSDGKQVVDAITFANSYAAKATSVTFGASKALQDGDLQDGQFGFTLKADGDAPMPDGAESGAVTVRNAANGSITFGSITFGKAGTYKYTVSEVNDGQDLVTYDDTVYEITVTVADNGKGQLVATVATTADGEPVDGMTFTNIQKKAAKPEEPATDEPAAEEPQVTKPQEEPKKPTIPKTGSSVAAAVAAALVLMVGAAGVTVVRNRRDD